ncbi:MAG: type II secretion system protein GspM [Lautropia sp.]
MLEPLLQRWQALGARDRRMLVLATVFIAIVVLWLFGFEPAWDGRRQLARELPALRGDLAQMDQLAAEARLAATGNAQVNESTAQLKARLEQSLADAGLSAATAQIEATGEIIEARFRQAEFEAWLYWLDGAVRETRMRVVDLSLTRESPGVVSGRVALEAPRRQ